MGDFESLLRNAKQGNSEAKEALWGRYRPLIRKMSRINGIDSEDLYQELCLTFFQCVKGFRIPGHRGPKQDGNGTDLRHPVN